jgi:tetratricopeptide (TPR) repeat protein
MAANNFIPKPGILKPTYNCCGIFIPLISHLCLQMRIKTAGLWLLLMLIALKGYAVNYTYDYTAHCKAAYAHYMELRLDEGNAEIRAELKEHPGNLLAIYLADYEDCLELMFNGDRAEYDKRKGHLDDRLELLSEGDQDSPWFRFCKSGINFHWALINIRFGENLKAATLFRKSFLQTKENNKDFPSFAPNKVFLGAQEAVVGTLPDDYKWIASLLGMKGNVRSGISKLAVFINSSPPDALMRAEAIIYYCYLRFYLLSQQNEVWNFVNNSTQFPTQNNLLHSFVKANIALNFRKGDIALDVLKKIQSDPDYNRFPIFDYEMGSALLHKLDPGATTYLSRFVSRTRGNFFVKDAWQKMAHSWYIQQNSAKADYCMKMILMQGGKMVDADKQAQRFAEGNIWPNRMLLQCRLLTDGGYYNQALALLVGTQGEQFKAVADKLEYYFRLGRIYDELGNATKAIQFYNATINLGRDRREHYAARSALQLGMMYEKAGKTAEAIAMYKQCLTIRNHDFQSNIDQQAKAGVDRLTKK